jgi:hypothetical protein
MNKKVKKISRKVRQHPPALQVSNFLWWQAHKVAGTNKVINQNISNL